ncbi:hypothetical protein [Pedobacter sp. Leaf194]|uniref:hypothetical protein n=1 Tax=Pedobacter sp. Leaf194 TaxID=1736297 RepID=UPI000702ED3A|nr:hypothetical protein [Pedobacter sp. Leaf194]KQS36190.1 hypothetical protein ASG14_12215 [Pedobacter sp. Leaf194]
MLKLKFILPAVLIVIASCNQKVYNPKGEGASGIPSDSLFVVLKINDVTKTGEQPKLQFTVHNEHSAEKSFCKWHTPFEPLMSKYLDIRDENGIEVAYKGPMAKRIMPPPAESYLVVKPKDTISANLDLLNAYQLEVGKKYTVSYNSSAVSGIKALNVVTFKYIK